MDYAESKEEIPKRVKDVLSNQVYHYNRGDHENEVIGREEAMHLYNYEDCVQTGGEISLFQKVVVYSGNKLAELSQGQLFLCIEKDRAECQERQQLWNW